MTTVEPEPVEPAEEPVEAPEPDKEPDVEPEPVEEPEAPQAPADEPQAVTVSPDEWEQRFKEIAAAFKRYTTKVTATLEESATELTPCPLCADEIPGYVNVNAAGRQPKETKEAVETFLGVTQEADYQRDPEHETCAVCQGLGKVNTGSLVPNYKLGTCPRCRGCGFTPPPGASTNGVVEPAPVLVAVGGDRPEPVRDDSDPWGSPRLLESGIENPNYGRMPQYKDPGLP